MSPARTPVKKVTKKVATKKTTKKAPSRKDTKKVAAEAPEQVPVEAPVRKKRASRKKPVEEVMKLTIEAGDEDVQRFKVLFEYHRGEVDKDMSADTMATLIFQAGLRSFEEAMSPSPDVEESVEVAEAPKATGNLLDLDVDEDDGYDPDFEDAFQNFVGRV